ncbi:MAG TPA: serine/threonine-protein kinase [Oculatellaceae cyanobacterium]
MTDFNDRTISSEAGRDSDDGEFFSPGRILSGKFKIISVMGTGGMGTVYCVEQVFLKQELALKVLDKRLVKSEVQMRRFQLEAVAAASLNHPNLVKVHDFGFLENKQPYLLMDFIRGVTLEDLLDKGRLSFEQAKPIFEQACEGLAFAHGKSIVHRDIKPGNIMIVPGSQPDSVEVRIVDFGIAKIASHEAGEVQALTRTGEIFGSPLYMSPEQCSGAPVDHRADIYSLGCAFFEALTGTPPFVGTNALRTMMLHQTGPIPSLTEASMGVQFPSGVDEILQCMLSKEPHERYQSMLEVADALRRVGTPQASSSKGPVSKSPKKQEKKGSIDMPIAVLAIVSATVLLTAVASFFTYQMLQSDQDKSQKAQNSTPVHLDTLYTDSIGQAMDKNSSREEARLQSLKSKLENIAPVSVELSGEGAEQKKVLNFPSVPLGVVHDLSTFDVVDGFRSTYEVTAVGKQSFKANDILILKLGDKNPGGFDNPQVLKKIDGNIFSGMEICSPERNFTGKENSKMESTCTAATLNIVKNWPNLKYLQIRTIFIDQACSDAMDECKGLEWVIIHDTLGSEDAFEHANWLRRVKTLSLSDCSAVDVLQGVAGSTKLERVAVENSASPDAIAYLKTCPHLKYLLLKSPGDRESNFLKITDQQIEQITALKHLKTLYLKRISVSQRQIDELTKSNPQLKLIVMDQDKHTRYFGAATPDGQDR